MLYDYSALSLIVWKVRKFVGNYFSLAEEKPKSNAKVITMFVSTIMHVGGDKKEILDLCHDFFEAYFLIDLGLILDNINVNLCIPNCGDFGVVNRIEEVKPILIIKKKA